MRIRLLPKPFKDKAFYSIAFLLLCSWMLKKNGINFFPNRQDHLFILRSFYYPRSSLFTESPTDSLVILFNMEEHIPVRELELRSFCVASGGRQIGWLPAKKPVKIDTLFVGEVKCRLTIYRMLCFPPEKADASNLVVRINSVPVKLKVTHADREKRSVVVCPGRMFAFEQWHLFVTAMEIHRLLKVDLVVVYIQSVDAKVYKLVNMYRLDGLIKVRPSLLMPSKLGSLDYNPNDETQWNTQVVNFQECLYEFRESADFLLFPDWDDLVATRNFEPLPSVLKQVSEDMPHVCGFVVARYIGAIQTLDKVSSNNQDLPRLWRHGISFTRNASTIQHVGKVLARPKVVNAIRFHDAIVPPGCQQAEAPMSSVYMIHARNYYDIPLEARLPNVSDLITNFRHSSIGRSAQFARLAKRLPKWDSALEQFYNCLGFSGTKDMWGRIFKIVQESTGSKCYSYARCGIHRVKLAGPCINVRNGWKTTVSRHTSISVLQRSSFFKSDYCIV